MDIIFIISGVRCIAMIEDEQIGTFLAKKEEWGQGITLSNSTFAVDNFPWNSIKDDRGRGSRQDHGNPSDPFSTKTKVSKHE